MSTRPMPLNMRLLRPHNAKPSRTAANVPDPEVVVTIPDPPPELSEEARAYWEDYARKLREMRVLSKADLTALAMLCESTATYWESMQKVREQGLVLKAPSRAGDYFIRNPFLTEANAAMAQMMKLLTEFGLTPSARVKIRADQ